MKKCERKVGVIIALLVVAQWSYGTSAIYRELKAVEFLNRSIKVAAKKPVHWTNFIPLLGLIILMDPYNVDIQISGSGALSGQSTRFNLDGINDFPFDRVKIKVEGDIVRVVDGQYDQTYAVFFVPEYYMPKKTP